MVRWPDFVAWYTTQATMIMMVVGQQMKMSSPPMLDPTIIPIIAESSVKKKLFYDKCMNSLAG